MFSKVVKKIVYVVMGIFMLIVITYCIVLAIEQFSELILRFFRL